MVVHLPIAFWVVASAAWALSVVAKKNEPWRFGLWLHTLGAVGAAVAVGFGYWATNKMGHDSPGHDLVHVHRDLMLVATGVSIALTGIAWWKHDARGPWRLALTAGSLLLLGVMTLGADRGAALVFAYGIGVADEPPTHTGDGHDHDHGEPGHHREVPSTEPHTGHGELGHHGEDQDRAH